MSDALTNANGAVWYRGAVLSVLGMSDDDPQWSIALTISSVIFLASPSSIMVPSL